MPADAAALSLSISLLAVLTLPVIWGAFALSYHVPGGAGRRTTVIAFWLIGTSAASIAILRGHSGAGLSIALPMLLALFAWWRTIVPSNDREWADDVARIVSAESDGDHISLHNVRNFDWHSETDYIPHWETRRYDLTQLQSVDLIMSYWNGPAIAHMLVSFGFEGDDYVAFSVEIRREKTESFSEFGGFFKQFELAIIAADERDVVRLRTNLRAEDDVLYRLQLQPATMRSLILAYADEANHLRETPRFYNSLTVNCTTLVHHMMKRIVGHLPWSYRLLLSGYLPGYVYDRGGLDRNHTLEELRRRGRITGRARAADASATFSADIRRDVPGIDD